MLQFGHGTEAVENLGEFFDIGGKEKLQFGHGTEAVENARKCGVSMSGRKSFNSATALRPWKTNRSVPSGNRFARLQFGHGTEAVENVQATQPLAGKSLKLQFGHGTEAVENQSSVPQRQRGGFSFNSATALRPWKTAEWFSDGMILFTLQFGHGTEAVENARKCGVSMSGAKASIRPRH